MAGILDFQCTYDYAAGFGEWVNKENEIRFPDAYLECGQMVKLALAVKRHNGDAFCQLPFCHTLEAEALGANIRPGNGLAGPRAGAYVYRTLEELDEMSPLNIRADSAGRMRETLAACRELSGQGERVVFLVSGPFTVLNSLAAPEPLLRAFVKKPDAVIKILKKLGNDLLTVMQAAEAAGAEVISYADPAGGVNILGPRAAARVAREFTAEFLRGAAAGLDPETVLLLCPKTALALVGAGCADWREWGLPKAMEYKEAAYFLRGKIRFGGQDCVNHAGSRLSDCMFKELVLI